MTFHIDFDSDINPKTYKNIVESIHSSAVSNGESVLIERTLLLQFIQQFFFEVSVIDGHNKSGCLWQGLGCIGTVGTVGTVTQLHIWQFRDRALYRIGVYVSLTSGRSGSPLDSRVKRFVYHSGGEVAIDFGRCLCPVGTVVGCVVRRVGISGTTRFARIHVRHVRHLQRVLFSTVNRTIGRTLS